MVCKFDCFPLKKYVSGFQIFFNIEILRASVETLLVESSKANRRSTHDCLCKRRRKENLMEKYFELFRAKLSYDSRKALATFRASDLSLLWKKLIYSPEVAVHAVSLQRKKRNICEKKLSTCN